jgi:NAD(P)-dependent dehydrogenase (short-subunit alcohol dehydrogenase family)
MTTPTTSPRATKRIFITGSSDGIGLETARQLATAGHQVVLHARDTARAGDAVRALPTAAAVVTGDLASLEGTRALAAAATAEGPFDSIVHNAGVGGGVPAASLTEDGIERIFQVNTVAPYLLTALMPAPGRLVYLTSGLESAGRVDFDDLQYVSRPWDGMQAYSDSKLYDVVLAFAVARLWLAASEDPDALASGRYLKRGKELEPNPAARRIDVQDRLLAELAALTGVSLG